MDMITNDLNTCNLNVLDNLLSDLKSYVESSATSGFAAHEVEREIFKKVLDIGAKALGYFFHIQGDGDVGETLKVDTGETYKRLNNCTRGYQSVFGHYNLTRAVYGTHESKKIEIAPLDTRLQLPSNEHSYVLQEWSQMIAIEVPFKKTMEILTEILPIKMSVDTLERINQSVGGNADSFREKLEQELPKQLNALEDEERQKLIDSVLVLSADGKGVPIRHPSDAARIESHQSKSGPKPDRKRMAVVGSAYTVAPYIRTPEQILEALFSEGAANNVEFHFYFIV